jgi:hypothetical protein
MSNSESELAPGHQRPVEISENVAREKLVEISQLPDTRPLIAVDLDDVLCQTTTCVAECALVFTQLAAHKMIDCPSHHTGHNRRFGTDMQIKEFYCQSDLSFTVVILSKLSPLPVDYTWYKVPILLL